MAGIRNACLLTLGGLFGPSLDRGCASVLKWPRAFTWIFFFGLFGRYFLIASIHWRERADLMIVALLMMAVFAALLGQTLAETSAIERPDSPRWALPHRHRRRVLAS